MMVWLQPSIKIVTKFKFGGGTLQWIKSHEHCAHIYHGVVLSPRLQNLNKTEFAKLKRIIAGSVLVLIKLYVQFV